MVCPAFYAVMSMPYVFGQSIGCLLIDGDQNMQSIDKLAHKLTVSIIHGTWEQRDIAERIAAAFDDKKLDANILAKNIIKAHDRQPRVGDLQKTIAKDKSFIAWVLKLDHTPKIMRINVQHDVMGAKPDFIEHDIPKIETYHDLALWLRLSDNDLAWFADCQGRQARVKQSKLHHYRYQWIKRKHGYPRLLEIPKSALKEIQRQILRDILDYMPPHDAVHGFRKNRSCKTHAMNHVGQDIVVRMDLENFFTSISRARVTALFCALGYPREIAQNLSALCVNTPSPYLLGSHYDNLPWQRQKPLLQPHLPQGAPTSPILANLCTWQLDKRLQGLADKMGVTYSRYADDMVFSGNKSFGKSFAYFRKVVEYIAKDEGFRINHRKTCIMTQAQRQSVVGVTVNDHPNISRTEYDALKATLHNCVRYGGEEQNRINHSDFKSYLRGRIAYIEGINSARGEKLYALYQQVEWSDK